MASSRLTLLLLLTLCALHVSAKSLKICSAPSCLFRNGTRCDRTSQDCPRCVMHDPLLGSPVCTPLQTGSVCLDNFTLCPETPLETTASSDAGYEWQPLNATTSPTTAAPTTRAPIQQAVANNVPLASTVVIEKSDKSGFPTWAIAVVVAAVVVVAGVLFLHVRRRRKIARNWQRDSTLPVPPPFKDEDLKYECSTNISSPHSFHSFDTLTIHPERAGKALSPPRPREDRAVQPHQHEHASDLEFSYVRASSSSMDSGIMAFTDSDRSAFYDDNIDVFLTRNGGEGDTDLRGSLGVDEIVVVRTPHSRQTSMADDDDEDVDIYPDTAVTRLSGGGRMFSPKTTRTLAMTNFTTFSIDDQEDQPTRRDATQEDEYPDTAVVHGNRPPSTAARRSAALGLDVVDVWESHRTTVPDEIEVAQHQQVAQWKSKYAST